MLIALSSNLNMKASTKHNCKSLLTHLYPPVTHKDPSLGKSVTRTSELISPSFKENGSKRLIASKFSIKCPVFKQKNTVSRLSIVASTVQPNPKFISTATQREKMAHDAKQKERGKLIKSQHNHKASALSDIRPSTRSLSNKSNKKAKGNKQATKKEKLKNLVMSMSKVKGYHINRQRVSMENANTKVNKDHSQNPLVLKLNALKERLKTLLIVNPKSAIIMKP
eukprot:TRINITY_DN14176_c0_g1_i2.p1 TRINITY_DN14176_c0_g1~~TRINITY_DN14176_c0_g1_i2.p1  ORF type:complete len:224 (-),score=35.12 TRINITY_DN14176_c0_g1_i2:60-731(-)